MPEAADTEGIQVLQCLIAGKSNAAIAEAQSIQIETVKTHCQNIYKKLRLKSRKEVSDITRRTDLRSQRIGDCPEITDLLVRSRLTVS